MRYLSQDLRDEAIRAHQQGITLEQLAGKLRITVPELRLVLGLPTTTDNMVAQRADYLWSTDRFGVL